MNGPPSYQRFFAELKRRRVFRVMAVYGAVAFGVVQIADLAFPRLGMPEWTVTLVLLLSLLGFPISIVLAWAFETTPEGVRRTPDADPEEIRKLTMAPASQRWPAGLAAAAGGALVVVAAWLGLGRPGAAAPETSIDPDAPVESIAVLPFADMSPDGSQAYFGDGLAEELLDALAKVDGLRVAARTSSFRFRGADIVIPDVARQLDVQAVLEGSVRSGGGRVRITAQLVDANGFHVWSETYDRTVDEMADLIGVQEDIAQSIVAAMALAPDTGGGEALETLVAQGTDNLEAYNAVLRGRHMMAQRSPAGLAGAVEQLEKAVDLDPNYARAWADLAMARGLAYGWGFRRDSARAVEAKDAVERALALDSRMGEAYTARGYFYTWVEPDSAKADQNFARAIELNPQFPASYQWRGEMLSDLGHSEAGIPYLEKALALDPLSPIIMVDLGETYDRAGRWYDADTLFTEAMALEPEFRPALQGLVFHAMYDGDAPAALDYVQRLEAASEGADSRRELVNFVLVMAAASREHDTVVRHFREWVPTDTSTIPPELTDNLDLVLWSLNEVEGPAAVRALVDAQVPRLPASDSVLAIALAGFAAAVGEDTAAARAMLRRLARASDPDATFGGLFVAAALGDDETATTLMGALPSPSPEDPKVANVTRRFFMDHLPLFDLVRGESEFRTVMDGLPPYTGPSGRARNERTTR